MPVEVAEGAAAPQQLADLVAEVEERQAQLLQNQELTDSAEEAEEAEPTEHLFSITAVAAEEASSSPNGQRESPALLLPSTPLRM